MTLYETMLTIRLVEDRLQEMCLRGEAGDLHFSKGQEAISVGVCAALRPTDHIVTHHRTIAHEIAKGAELYPLIAEVLGKRTGLNRGRAGEMHVHNAAIRHDFSFQLVGTCVPVSVGIAWALKNVKKVEENVVCFFGDAATSNGQIHEGFTIAAIHKVPLLLVCENNELAGNIRPEHYLPPGITVADRMLGYGIPSMSVDGNNVHEVREATLQVLPQLRRGPFMLEMRTTRLCWHKQGQRDIRTKEELDVLAERDPLILGDQILKLGRRKELRAAVDAAFDRAIADPNAEFV
jgi:TPP-dependent pyruvate/acetoin dehydrogenase alpha subunit